MSARDELDVLAQVMHDAYEAAAPALGWRTNPESRKPWAEVPAANKATMRYAVNELITHLDARTSRWRECARDLACALEVLLDSEHYDVGLQVTDEGLAGANRALNARLALIDDDEVRP